MSPVSTYPTLPITIMVTRALTEDILEVREARRADDGRGDARLREHPRDSDLRHAHARALALRERLDRGDDVQR